MGLSLDFCFAGARRTAARPCRPRPLRVAAPLPRSISDANRSVIYEFAMDRLHDASFCYITPSAVSPTRRHAVNGHASSSRRELRCPYPRSSRPCTCSRQAKARAAFLDPPGRQPGKQVHCEMGQCNDHNKPKPKGIIGRFRERHVRLART